MERLGRIFGSPARLKTLRLFLFNPESAYTLAEVSSRTRLSKETARREVHELFSSGFLRKKGNQSPSHYLANQNFEHFAALNSFVRDTANVQPQYIVKVLKRAGVPQLVALSGHFSGVIESQIDLLIVGDRLDERKLAHTVHALEAELGREIRYASFTVPDFRYRLEVYDRLVRDVFDYPHRLLLDKIGL